MAKKQTASAATSSSQLYWVFVRDDGYGDRNEAFWEQRLDSQCPVCTSWVIMPPGHLKLNPLSSCLIAASFDSAQHACAACALAEEGNQGKVFALALLAQVRVRITSICETRFKKVIGMGGRKLRGDVVAYKYHDGWYVATFRDFRNMVAALADIKRRLEVPTFIEVNRHGARGSVEWCIGQINPSVRKYIYELEAGTELWLAVFDNGLCRTDSTNNAGRRLWKEVPVWGPSQPSRLPPRNIPTIQKAVSTGLNPGATTSHSTPPQIKPVFTKPSATLLYEPDCALVLTTSRIDPPAELFALLFTGSAVTPSTICIRSVSLKFSTRTWCTYFDSSLSTRTFRDNLVKTIYESQLALTIADPNSTRHAHLIRHMPLSQTPSARTLLVDMEKCEGDSQDAADLCRLLYGNPGGGLSSVQIPISYIDVTKESSVPVTACVAMFVDHEAAVKAFEGLRRKTNFEIDWCGEVRDDEVQTLWRFENASGSASVRTTGVEEEHKLEHRRLGKDDAPPLAMEFHLTRRIKQMIQQLKYSLPTLRHLARNNNKSHRTPSPTHSSLPPSRPPFTNSATDVQNHMLPVVEFSLTPRLRNQLSGRLSAFARL